MFNFFIKKYLDTSLSRSLLGLYIGKTMVMAGTALLGLFLPIFLYNLFDGDFKLVMAYYGLGYLFYGLTVVFGAQLLNKIGFRRGFQISVLFGALFYAIFYFMNKDNYLYLIPLSLFVLIIYRLLYWIPYHTNFAKFTSSKSKGREVSMFNATRLALSIFIPTIAGLIIINLGFNILFLIAIFLYLGSGIPYFFIEHTKEKFSWSFKETWEYLLLKRRRNITLAYFARGAENVIDIIVWPVFIYQILQGNYFEVGAISTLIIGASIIVQLVLGREIDLDIRKKRALKFGSFFYAIGWIIKIFITSAYHIFLVGVYHRIARIFVETSFDSITYEIAADEGHYIDEFTVLHDMAINFGKSLMAGLVIIVSLFLGMKWLFALAVLFVFFFNLLRKCDSEKLNNHFTSR